MRHKGAVDRLCQRDPSSFCRPIMVCPPVCRQASSESPQDTGRGCRSRLGFRCGRSKRRFWDVGAGGRGVFPVCRWLYAYPNGVAWRRSLTFGPSDESLSRLHVQGSGNQNNASVDVYILLIPSNLIVSGPLYNPRPFAVGCSPQVGFLVGAIWWSR